MANPALPQPRVVSVQGDAVVVQVQRVPNAENEYSLHITRNGNRETRFHLDELTQVNARLGELIVASRSGPQPRQAK